MTCSMPVRVLGWALKAVFLKTGWDIDQEIELHR
jgi:hypothetical protein